MGGKTNIDVLVGCQYGSEGKGLVSAEIAKNNKYDWVVSVNSAQAGHTAYVGGNKIVTRHLPSSCLTNTEARIFIGPGSVINLKVLIEEIDKVESLGISIKDRLYIARTATVITDDDITKEKDRHLTDQIGSTSEGISTALCRKISREKEAIIGNHPIGMEHDSKYYYIVSSDWLSGSSGEVFLEGSQGHGLSIFEDHYPFCTSRDTSTAAFISYARMNPRNIRHVYGVYRTFPIRVGGNSGPMYEEKSWSDIAKISGYEELSEYTTVTGRLRRIGLWDHALARYATRINGVNRPVLTFANYLSKEIEGVTDSKVWDNKVKLAIDGFAYSIEMPWWGISTSRHGDFEYNYTGGSYGMDA